MTDDGDSDDDDSYASPISALLLKLCSDFCLVAEAQDLPF